METVNVKATAPAPDLAKAFAACLLAWYDEARRDLPWRAPPGVRPDAYAVWLSEIMLQQTTVKAVKPYFGAFLARWPRIEALAAAPLDDVLAAWAGLGYYSRARNLHACAKQVVERHGGRFPETAAELAALPGIGAYTAAAISAIAFGRSAMPVDANIERVVARLLAIETPFPAGKAEVRRKAQALIPDARAGDLAQAMMDLGAAICTSRRPSCLLCPVKDLCAADARGIAGQLPAKPAKSARPERFGVAFFALREDGEVLLRRRPEQGLLGGMLEVPSTAWAERWPSADAALQQAPIRCDWWAVPGVVVHTFTHLRLNLMVYRAVVPADAPLTLFARADDCRWVPRRELGAAALPTVMKKVIQHGG